MANPAVTQAISDPDFGKLSPQDQQGVLSKLDPDFAKVKPEELPQVVQGIQKANAPVDKGEQTNDIGKTVIVPKEDEEFSDTMNRAVAQGKKTTQQDIDDEMATAPKKAATVLAAAPAIGAGGAAALAGSGVVAKDAAGLGAEYVEHFGREGVAKIAEMAQAHPEATKMVVKTLLGLLAGEGFGAPAKGAALGLLSSLLK